MVFGALAALAVALIGCVTLAPAASAHPFGDPESAAISLTGPDVVRVRWKVGMLDDYTYLAEDLGLLPEERVLLDGAIDVQPGDPALLEGAPEFRDYVLRHIRVSVGGQRCSGELAPVDGLAAHGLDVDFTCPEPVTSASVMISMLTDLSSYYTTMASGPDGQRQAYVGDQDTYTWTFGSDAASAETGRSAVLQLAGVSGVVALGVAAVVVVRRVRRHRIGQTAPSDQPDDEHADEPTPAGAGA